MALGGRMGLNKYLHHAHTCSKLSSRDAQGAQSSLEVKPFLSSAANLCLDTDTPTPSNSSLETHFGLKSVKRACKADRPRF